jgi:hypothetical protein
MTSTHYSTSVFPQIKSLDTGAFYIRELGIA